MKSPLETVGLKLLEEQCVIKCDGVCSNKLLHAMLPLTVPLKIYSTMKIEKPEIEFLNPHLTRPALVHGCVLPSVHRRGGLVGLTRGSVKGHHPVMRILKRADVKTRPSNQDGFRLS